MLQHAGPGRPRIPITSRFWSKIQFASEDECWLWLGATNGGGYGNIRYNGRHFPAHRISWMLHYGKIPEGINVCHHCDAKACVNPAHLFLGTDTDNMRDAAAKGKLGRRDYQS